MNKLTHEQMNEKMGKIHNEDCLEFMKQVPDNYFQCIFSDVPYIINSGGGNSETKSGFGWKEKQHLESFNSGKLFTHNDITEKDYMGDLFRILDDTGHIYIMCNSAHLSNIEIEMRRVGFIINNILVMIKNNMVTNQHYMKNCEFTIFARKGGSKGLNDFGIPSAFNVTMPTSDKYHISQKPIKYVETLIQNSTKKGDRVYDPFMGSGTVGIVAKSLGLDFIGTEIDKEFCRIANKRLEAVQGSLF